MKWDDALNSSDGVNERESLNVFVTSKWLLDERDFDVDKTIEFENFLVSEKCLEKVK